MLYVIQPTYMIQTLFSNKETEGDQATIRPSGVAQFNDEPALTGATHRTGPIRHCEITREDRRGEDGSAQTLRTVARTYQFFQLQQ